MSRRAFDLAVATAGLVVLSPLLALLALAVRASSPGPILHRATRVGRGGEPFTVYKFRTMVVGAAAAGPGVTRAGDPRITSLGRWLRRTKLDEVPQLWNVVRGDMSLVGPRPEDPRYVARYTEAQRAILAHRPGITSPASVRFRDEEAILAAAGDDVEAAYDRIMAEKLRIDLEHFARRSLRADLGVLVATLRAIAPGR